VGEEEGKRKEERVRCRGKKDKERERDINRETDKQRGVKIEREERHHDTPGNEILPNDTEHNFV
jgi:hypothetical protein